jgi:hypothetical protein
LGGIFGWVFYCQPWLQEQLHSLAAGLDQSGIKRPAEKNVTATANDSGTGSDGESAGGGGGWQSLLVLPGRRQASSSSVSTSLSSMAMLVFILSVVFRDLGCCLRF